MTKKNKRKSHTKKKEKGHNKKKKKNIKKIKDPPFSKKDHRGSDATKGMIDYHYQHYSNIIDYLEIICNKNKTLSKKICFIGDDHIDAYLTFDLKQYKKGIHSKYLSDDLLIKIIKECIHDKKTKYIPLMLETVKGKKHNHANIILIDIDKKNIELFEPHGLRKTDSILHGIKYSYIKKKKALHDFFMKYLPGFNIINVVDIIEGSAFQSIYDAHSGYCITWSLLYCHYRLLNPKIPYSQIITYLHKTIKLNHILRYAQHIEEVLKNES